MTTIQLPRSAHTGILWPALPAGNDALVLALQHQFEQSQWWGPETIERVQLRQLEHLLAHARATVPFYRDRLEAVTSSGRGGLTMDLWRRIPILRRVEIQETGAALVSHRLPRGHGTMGDVRTSGSTGRPIAVKVTGITALFFLALNLRYHLWHRRDFSAKVAGIRSVAGDQAEAARTGKPVNWSPAHRSGPMYFFDISRPIGEQVEWLARHDPEHLLTNPSNLQAIVDYCDEAGIRLSRLREVTTMGETLDPATRSACGEAWSVPVHDIYSAEEMGLIAMECPEHNRHHVQAESVLVEVIDDDDRPCAPGETGRVVITDLHNFAMPLIRYEIGDYAEVGEPCPCGRGLPAIERILGRTRNMLTLPSGATLWPNLPPKPLTTMAPIRQLQIIQHSVERLEVRLVTPRRLTAAEETRLREYLIENFRHTFDIGLVYVDEIPRAASGKYEGFISRVGAASAG